MTHDDTTDRHRAVRSLSRQYNSIIVSIVNNKKNKTMAHNQKERRQTKGTTNDSQNFAAHSVVTSREMVTQCGKINRRSETWCVHLERYLLVNVSIFVPQLIKTWSSKFVLFESTSSDILQRQFPGTLLSGDIRAIYTARLFAIKDVVLESIVSVSERCRRWSARFGSVSILH
jgi:hypothetical protein